MFVTTPATPINEATKHFLREDCTPDEERLQRIERAGGHIRVNVVTGSTSRIGTAATELLESRRRRAIVVDLHYEDVNITLVTAESRPNSVDEVTELCGENIDVIYSIAGASSQTSLCVWVKCVSVRAPLNGLRRCCSDPKRLVRCWSHLSEVALPSASSLSPRSKPDMSRNSHPCRGDRRSGTLGTSPRAVPGEVTTFDADESRLPQSLSASSVARLHVGPLPRRQ